MNAVPKPRMPRSARWILGAVLLVPPAAGAQTAEAPHWNLGDKWRFHEKSSPPDKEEDWSREVVEVLPDGNFSVVMGSGRKLEFDSMGNSMDKRGPEYSWQRLRFPMTVGMKWSHERKIAGDTWHGQEKSAWEVKAYEKITVPAGTFDCFKVSGQAYSNWDSATSIAKGYNRSYNNLTYWYCPAIKWVARWETDANAYVSAPMTHSVSELVSFEARP
jgi:hypothetical protein